MKKATAKRAYMILEIEASKIEFTALGKARNRMWPRGTRMRECDAAALLLKAALANYHLLESHIFSLTEYCSREKIHFNDGMIDLIARQFRIRKPRGKK